MFGSLVCFSLAHLAIFRLRVKEPDLRRPFKIAWNTWNIRIKGKELPVTAIFGLLATAIILMAVIVFQPYSRWEGLAWMIIDLISFYIFLRFRGIPFTNISQELTRTENIDKLYAIDKNNRT